MECIKQHCLLFLQGYKGGGIKKQSRVYQRVICRLVKDQSDDFRKFRLQFYVAGVLVPRKFAHE